MTKCLPANGNHCSIRRASGWTERTHPSGTPKNAQSLNGKELMLLMPSRLSYLLFLFQCGCCHAAKVLFIYRTGMENLTSFQTCTFSQVLYNLHVPTIFICFKFCDFKV